MELLLTVEQAAERLQIKPYTVREHLKRGLLRGIKRGRLWRVPESALIESSAPTEFERSPQRPPLVSHADDVDSEDEIFHFPHRDEIIKVRIVSDETAPFTWISDDDE